MAERGKDFLIKLGDDTSSPTTWTTIGGLRSNGVTINNEPIDITDKDSVTNRRLLLETGGVQSMNMQAEGIFKSNAVFQEIFAASVANTHVLLQIISPILGTFEGLFMIANMQLTGPHNNVVNYSATFESASEYSYTPATP